MNAIYKGRIYRIAEVGPGHTTIQLEDGPTVEAGDVDLTVDPTDRQVADAENLAEWYEITDARELADWRQFLRGDIDQDILLARHHERRRARAN